MNTVDTIAKKVEDGGRVDASEALALYRYASTHLLGLSRSMELASIGRRAAENEHDVLALITPHLDAPTPSTGDGTGIACRQSGQPMN